MCNFSFLTFLTDTGRFYEAGIQVTSVASKITVKLNDFTTIPVQFSQTPVSVYWVHQNLNGSKTTVTIDGIKYSNSPITDLTLVLVGPNDWGFYDCFASDGVDINHLEQPVLLFQSGTPSVTSSMTSLDIDPIGQTIELNSVYSDIHIPSDPNIKPDVTWLHCDISDICSRIDKGDTLKYSGSNATHPSLTILNYAEDDFGTYWCQVKNEVGTSSSYEIKLTGTVNATVETTTIPDSTLTSNVTTGQCGGYNSDVKAIFIQYAGAKGSIGYIEDKINVPSSIRCALYCLQCDNCNGYNYQKTTGTCQLLQSLLSNYVTSNSWDFFFQQM
ncbi:unnamed protein product [Mytilus coruscus]|uniref:Ig-like domain-containing protein n=1 Tax=Mytilus coruscus TaxID=42192 RepID=A0A6J8BHT6_MYTCO|nr:unnamed protein product [Mytilus coruscus]